MEAVTRGTAGPATGPVRGRRADDVLSPEAVAALDDLELAARVVVEGLRAGAQRSPFHGVGAEFEQHRPYRLGDDLRHVDWKAYGRSDRLYTRQFREATNLSVMLVLDTSASMDWPREGVTKFRMAVVIAAALAWLVAGQGNAVGLFAMDGGRPAYLPPRANRVHLRALLARLARLAPAGTWRPDVAIQRAADRLARRGMLVVLSDFYDAEAETQRALRQVAHRGHDVTLLQLLAPAERALPFTGQREVRDLETGERRVVDAAVAGAAYRAAVEAFVARTRRAAVSAGMDYALIATDVPPSRALRDWLVRRGAGLPAPASGPTPP